MIIADDGEANSKHGLSTDAELDSWGGHILAYCGKMDKCCLTMRMLAVAEPSMSEA